jgi:hypothetical protein
MLSSSLQWTTVLSNSGHRSSWNSLPETLGGILYSSLHSLPGGDEVSRGSHDSQLLLVVVKVFLQSVVVEFSLAIS